MKKSSLLYLLLFVLPMLSCSSDDNNGDYDDDELFQTKVLRLEFDNTSDYPDYYDNLEFILTYGNHQNPYPDLISSDEPVEIEKDDDWKGYIYTFQFDHLPQNLTIESEWAIDNASVSIFTDNQEFPEEDIYGTLKVYWDDELWRTYDLTAPADEISSGNQPNLLWFVPDLH